MLRHLLTNVEIAKCYQNDTKFNGVYSRDKLSKIKHVANVINLDEYESKGTHWVASYLAYIDGFGVEYNPQKTKTFS